MLRASDWRLLVAAFLHYHPTPTTGVGIVGGCLIVTELHQRSAIQVRALLDHLEIGPPNRHQRLNEQNLTRHITWRCIHHLLLYVYILRAQPSSILQTKLRRVMGYISTQNIGWHTMMKGIGWGRATFREIVEYIIPSKHTTRLPSQLIFFLHRDNHLFKVGTFTAVNGRVEGHVKRG